MSGITLGVYPLCFLTCVACMGLLFRGYRRTGTRLLLWSALCFVFLSLNNLLLFVDTVFLPDTSLKLWRTLCSLTAVTLMAAGFIWESD